MVVRSRRRAALVTLAGGYANVLVSTAGALLLIPFYLTYIGSRLYGAWLGSGGILAWLAVLDLGLASLMIQRIAEAHGRNERARIGDYLSTGLALQLLMVALMVAGAALLAPRFPSWMGISGSEASQLSAAFMLAAAANGINVLNNGAVGFLRALQITVLPNVLAMVASVTGMVTTLVMLFQGWGVRAIPAGLVVGGVLQLILNVPYGALIYRREVSAPLRPTRATVRDFMAVSGPLLASKLGTAAMNRSDAALITILLRPELATSYALTRRAADVVQRLLDRFGAAAFAGFSHLVSCDEHQRAGQVHRQIMDIYSGAGAVMIGAYLAGNAAFVDLWVGEAYFLGPAVTILVGLAVFAGGASSLANYLLGATGRITAGAWIGLGEAMARVPLMLILLLSVGVVGLPVAVLLTAVIAGVMSVRMTFAALGHPDVDPVGPWRSLAVKAGVVAAGALIGALWQPTSWIGLGALLTMYTVAGGLLLVTSLPELRRIALPRWRARFGNAAEGAA
ncbi:MAG TPA: hypothetical protein VFZ73_01165 [Gemmatimonadaceae bacterium]